MGVNGYTHSPYFRAKQAAKKAYDLVKARVDVGKRGSTDGARWTAAQPKGAAKPRRRGRPLSLEKRVAQIGKVEFWRTKELVDIACVHRLPYDVQKWDTSTWGNALGCNPAALGFAIAADIGEAMVRDVRAIADPEVRAALKDELVRALRIVRRPWYYARETARRRQLAAERRKLHRRRTANPCPTAEGILAAWNVRKTSKEAMIVLGGMLHDLECFVDNTLRFDEDGNVVGRNGGIRGWLKENLPDLVPKYKTLMRYKAMAIRLRQVTRTQDPLPTDDILREPRSKMARDILSADGDTFNSLLRAINWYLDEETVLRGPREGLCRGSRKIGVPRRVWSG